MSLSVLLPTAALGAAPTLVTRTVQDGLVIPWDLAFAPGGQMIVTERPGRVRVFAGGQVNANLVATSRISHVHAEGEAGVMGIAVDHDFANTRWVYICVSRDADGAWRNQLIRYRMTSTWHLDNAKFLIESGMRASPIHNGCAVQEGPDHKIWISMGDANHPFDAQNPNRLNGKILRINRDGSRPGDNPIWPGHSRPGLVFSIGHRNPQGIAIEPETNRVYAVEHGPDRNDEVNWIRPGLNYGWPCVTGRNHPYMSCSGSPTFTNPAWSTEGATLATSGGTFVSGPGWDSWQGNLFVSTLKESDIRRYTVNAPSSSLTLRQTLFNNTWGRLRASVLGPGGQLFVTTSNGNDDRVVRITPN